MNIHEFQAKMLLARHGVAVPEGGPCRTPEEARLAAERMISAGHRSMVVKAQIHAGGRGKGVFKSGFQGGVKLCDSAASVFRVAQAMLGAILVTKQTGPEGRRVGTILVAAAERIVKELYFAILLDRSASCPVVMASSEGGVDIEEVAASAPEKMVKVRVDPALGLQAFQARNIAVALGLSGGLIGKAAALFSGAFETFWASDASLVEVNPLCVVKEADGTAALRAVDAKISLDDNALYRHPEIREMRDLAEEAPLEVEASRHGLNYIKLDGDIACMVNGAGLAMATMDIIKRYGGNPANFLDVGGGASQEQVAAAFRIILSDPNVKGILVNIFGGIMQCDVIAAGIVAAVKETEFHLPLVVRLEGNNVAKGKTILAESGLAIINGDSMADGAERVVKAIGLAA